MSNILKKGGKKMTKQIKNEKICKKCGVSMLKVVVRKEYTQKFHHIVDSSICRANIQDTLFLKRIGKI